VPLDFLRLVWAGLAGYLLFAEVPDLWSLIGGTLIVASAIYITRRQRLTKAAPVRSDEPN
jgi:drug/metabolite transporter (DMT)-like permease